MGSTEATGATLSEVGCARAAGDTHSAHSAAHSAAHSRRGSVERGVQTNLCNAGRRLDGIGLNGTERMRVII